MLNTIIRTLFCVAAISVTAPIQAQADRMETPIEAGPRSALSTPIVMVQDIDISIAFYQDILGFKATKIFDVDKIASTRPLGLDHFGGFRVSYFAPQGDFKSKVDTLALAQPLWPENKPAALAQSCKNRNVRVGQVSLSFEVHGIEEILERAAENDVCITSPLTLSGTGRSRVIGLMDPNGIALELYEYVKNPK